MINDVAQNSRYKDENHYKALRDDYMTPPQIYLPILDFFKRSEFDIDVCCTVENIPAKKHFTQAENGLIKPWAGLCFCNPPWDKSIKWVKKAVAELMLNPDLNVVFVLSADKMYIGYVQDHIVNNPDSVYLILPGKQGFIIPGQESVPPVPSVGVMIAIISKHAGEIEYGLNFYNPFNTAIIRGQKIQKQHIQKGLFDKENGSGRNE